MNLKQVTELDDVIKARLKLENDYLAEAAKLDARIIRLAGGIQPDKSPSVAPIEVTRHRRKDPSPATERPLDQTDSKGATVRTRNMEQERERIMAEATCLMCGKLLKSEVDELRCHCGESDKTAT